MPESAEEFIKFIDSDSPVPAAKIKVIGVGGAGGNAVEHMIGSNFSGIEYYCANTDAQALRLLSVDNKLQLGSKITRGLGAGADPEVGYAAAMEDREQIREILQGCDLVFIAAGMGGGTGTGAAPVIAKVAREAGVLTVAVINRPFPFEQRKRIAVADKGVVELYKNVDSLIVVPNAKLLEVLPEDTNLVNAFAAANDVLLDAVRGISDIITNPGHINVDFADVKTVMSKRGMAMMGIGIASRDDPNPGAAATRAAISSPLLENVDISSAAGLLVNVSGDNHHLTMRAWKEAGEVAKGACDLDDDMIVGLAPNPALGDKVQVTLIATGLQGKSLDIDDGEEAGDSSHSGSARGPLRQAPRGASPRQPGRGQQAPHGSRMPGANRQDSGAEPVSINRPPRKAANDGPANLDYLDIPAFLRRNAD